MRHRFAFITTIITFIALLLGNLVVATKSGDACGETWPKCNGNFVPDITDINQIIEYSHRAFTTILGFVILINIIIALKKKLKKEKLVTVLSFISLFILLLQSLIGGFNVLLGTPPGFTTLDTTVSLTLLGSLVLLTTSLKRKPVHSPSIEEVQQEKRTKKLFYPILVSFTLYFLEVVIGAFFKHSAASKVMFDIPIVEQLVHSKFVAGVLYYSHGTLNTIIVISSLWLLFYAYRYKVEQTLSTLFLLFVLTTGLTGYIAVLYDLGAAYTSMHMITSTITIMIGAAILGKSWFGIYVRR